MSQGAKRLACACLVVAATAVPRGALAESHGEALAEATALLQSQEYEAARALLRRTLEGGGLTADELADAYRGLAECGAALREPQESREAFVRLLALREDFSLPELASPLLREPFDEAAAFWEGQARPSLRVDLPEGARQGEPLVVVAAMEASALPGFADEVVVHVLRPGGMEGTTRGAPGRVEVDPELFEGRTAIELYVVMLDEHGNEVASEGSARDPISVPVESTERRGEGRRAASGATEPWYRRWWVWTIVGAGVVGLATGLSLGLTIGVDGGGDPCEQALGQACDQTVTFR